MKTAAQNRSRFMRIISAPIRVLCKARDLYVQTLSDYADRVGYGNMGCPGGPYPALPRSFSTASSRSNDEDDLRELIRAASARSFGGRIDVEAILQRQNSGAVIRKPSQLGPRVLPKSSSVGMGRIEEDAPCDFSRNGADVMLLYPRSRSCAVARRVGWGIETKKQAHQ
ncbi:uncharacterized protein LOC116214523 [Punica granatum]|uniref:Uncharacterized protein n=2 Tax=Punica granatum TaxID=22663 RepID=A0A218WE40_PUNGR|nr:uncharacterized protein LOC116214523 [Punica granatum]OWM70769.1 hypothetical protein CDL15_Pgr014442 [Punica granatum]PKI41707.1 hypothetical protein CRG98_037909 [Punica granatum]